MADTPRAAGMRFGLSAPGFADPAQLVARARWAESSGFATFAVSDHLNGASPFVTLQAVAAATTTIRLGTLVINNDFRHPAVLAQDAATVDLLSDGRLELGIGAGWARAEYERAGLAYDPPAVRIERLRETVTALRTLLSGELATLDGPHVNLRGHYTTPRPPQGASLPLLIGGNGDALLTLAAEQADIVGFTGFSPDREGHNQPTHFTRSGLADRVALVRRASAHRERPPELNLLLQSLTVTDDREYLATTLAQRRNASPVEMLTCPFLAFGTVEEICGQLLRLRDEHGITYITVFNPYADDTARVIAALDAFDSL